MSGADTSMLSEILTAAFLVIGAAITLIGTIGLLRLPRFLERAHATTLGTTLGTACVALASVIHFSAIAGSSALHGVLIIVFITVTTDRKSVV